MGRVIPIRYAGRAPACFDSQAAYDEWVHLSKMVQSDPTATPCSDCTKAYQQRMISEGRCENPGVQFGRNGRGLAPRAESEVEDEGQGKEGRREERLLIAACV